MESENMGRVLVEATVENRKDLWESESGQRATGRWTVTVWKCESTTQTKRTPYSK